MIFPKPPKNETARLQALRDLNLLGTKPEKEFDQITQLAAYICQTPISLISLIDKKDNWFKSKNGIDIPGNPRKYSHCGHAILDPENIMEVQDTRKDERFRDNPFTLAKDPVIFYSGVPLMDKRGHALGTLCVIDNVPRKLEEKQKAALRALADQVTKLFELRERNDKLKKTRKDLENRNKQLKDFAGVVSHDMKMPLSNIIVTIDLIKKKYGNNLPEKAVKYLESLKNTSFSLSDYVTSMLEHYESDTLAFETTNEAFDLHDLLEDIVDLLNITDACEIKFPKKKREINCNKIALEQILLNLINNSLKYNDKEETQVKIKCKEDELFYYFKIKDNGIGIPKEKQEHIFQLFTTATEADRKGKKGNGIGLSTVKKLVENLGGTIKVSSKPAKGTTFSFTIKKTPLQ